MHTNRRLVARVLASLTLLLAIGGGVLRLPAETIDRPVPVAASRRVDPAPSTPDLADMIHTGVVGHWYAVAAWIQASPPEPPPPAPRPPQVHRDPSPVDLSTSDGDRFDRLAGCESGQNPQSVSPGGRYRGAFQFSLPTWQAAGMTGDPINYSYDEQKRTAMFWSTQADPSTQWPVCWRRTA